MPDGGHTLAGERPDELDGALVAFLRRVRSVPVWQAGGVVRGPEGGGEALVRSAALRVFGGPVEGLTCLVNYRRTHAPWRHSTWDRGARRAARRGTHREMRYVYSRPRHLLARLQPFG